MVTKYVYLFGNKEAEGRAEMRNLLGGKGANLSEMANMGIPVPPGFVITTEACNYYFQNKGNYPKELKSQVEDGIRNIERIVKTSFGDEKEPLLVSIRSGARVSMPGMMDTVLNLGLNELTVRGIAEKTQNPRFAFDSYRRFIQMYGEIVLSISKETFDEIFDEKKKKKGAKFDTELTAEDLDDIAVKMKSKIRKITGKEFPSEPREQLWAAVGSVFKSWNNQRAISYRKINKIPDEWGTAVVVQAMVFGNMGTDSGSGVVFSRNPSTGEKKLWGEFLSNAQGEDVVAGIRTPLPIDEMKKVFPECHKELTSVAEKLERHFKDLQDIEFTIQKKRLWLLQTRAGKRTSQAAIKIAMDMVREKLINGSDVFQIIKPADLDNILHPILDPKAKKEVIARGLPASPGVATGKIVFDSAELVELSGKDNKYILVRNETSADDVTAMHAASGVLTARGGMTSHAAVVARGMGKCAVVGCTELNIDSSKEEFKANNKVFKKGDFITLDGSSGEVLAGKLPVIPPKLGEEFRELLIWTDMAKTLGVKANADTPEDARIARELGAEGIGLCRTEHMFFQPDRIDLFRKVILSDTVEERENALANLLPIQRGDFRDILKAMEGLPVTIRFLDPPLHEFLPHTDEELKALSERINMPLKALKAKAQKLNEFNPMLGHRGSRLGITYPEIYRMQARAVMEAAVELFKQGYNVMPEIMLPIISSTKELEPLKKLVIDTCEEVKTMGKAETLSYKIGIMIELPRAAVTADKLAPMVDFFSFGTNDLTQTTLGMSRDDASSFLPFYIQHGIISHDPFARIDEEGVGELVKMGVAKGKSANPHLECGVCGEHGGDPESVEFFHRNCLDYVSCSPYRVPIARFAASRAALSEKARHLDGKSKRFADI